MGAVRTKTVAGLRHRPLQAVVIGIVLLMASGAATLALDTLVESQAPFEHAFATANGAHLAIDYDGATTAAQLAATAHSAPVTDSAGPWPVGQVGFLVDLAGAGKAGDHIFEGGSVSGRSNPDTSVDRITLFDGRWWQGPGEIVLAQSEATRYGKAVGDTIDLQQAPARGGGKESAHPAPGPPSAGNQPDLPTKRLTIVGIAASISTPGVYGWLSPADIAALTPGQVPSEEMLYRVQPSTTPADLAAAESAITGDLPADAVQGAQTYLALKENVDRTAEIFVPILLAFAGFALLAAAFIIANVVSGIVLTSYRDIGVMKAVGYTPRQVTTILLGEILVPATVGSVAGVLVGTIGSQPILAQTARAFGLPTAFTLSVPVIVAVLGAAAVTVVIAAVGPAARAGRLSSVAALTRGSMPAAGGRPGRLLRRVHESSLPAPIRLGIASGVARPLRAAMTLGALTVGVAALVFAIGLDRSLQVVAGDLIRDHASPVRLELFDPSFSAAQVDSLLAADVRTDRYVALGQRDVTVPALGPIPFVAYQGDSSWIGYALIHGRWFSAPGEAVAPTNFFTQSGLHVGDQTTASLDGRSITVTLVGEIFDQARENRDDLVLRGEWSDLATLAPTISPTQWEVLPKSGVDHQAYASSLGDATNHAVGTEVVQDSSTDEGFLLFEGVISALGAVLVAISLGGVLNMTLLETRQRTRETAVLKAIGMTPRQVVGSVVASVVPAGLLAGALGVPLGLGLQHIVLGFMGQAAIKTDIPSSALDVFVPPVLIAMGFGGLAIAAIGAYLPAQRAAHARIAPVLQAE